MKKCMILAVFLWFVCHANSIYSQKVFIGSVGAYNSTNVQSNIDEAPTQFLHSFSGGINLEYRGNDWLSFYAEVNYNERGFTFKDDYYYPRQKTPAYVNFYYWSYPVGFVVRTNKRFYVFCGLGFDPSVMVSIVDMWPSSTSQTWGVAGIPTFDFGEYIEPGIGFKLNKRVIIKASARARYSFTTVTNVNYNPGYSIQNYGFGAQLGISYGL